MNGFRVTQPVEKVEALFPDVWCCLLNPLGLCATPAQRVPPAGDDAADERSSEIWPLLSESGR